MAATLEARIEGEARFAADVSHEMRSPLAALAAALDVIDRRRDQLPPQVSEAFAVLTGKVRMFQQTVLDLLEISRMNAESASPSQDSIDLQQFLGRLLTVHGADDAVIDIDHRAPTHIQGDRRRLDQAIGNIMDNAKRYAGGVKHVSVAAPMEGTLQIALEDRGPGVPAGEREAIFGRFARGEVGVNAGTMSGTGLGLALVAEHLRLHHGRAWVEAAPGGGARFVVELPVGAG